MIIKFQPNPIHIQLQCNPIDIQLNPNNPIIQSNANVQRNATQRKKGSADQGGALTNFSLLFVWPSVWFPFCKTFPGPGRSPATPAY